AGRNDPVTHLYRRRLPVSCSSRPAEGTEVRSNRTRSGGGASAAVRVLADLLRTHRAPAGAVQHLQRLEARLVGHLAGIADPVAKVDVRLVIAARLADQPHYHVAAEAAPRVGGIEEAVDRRQSVLDPVGEAGAEQHALAV